MTDQSNKNEKISLKAQLKGEILEMFLDLKKWYGVDADAELARILIRNQYRNIFEKNGSVEDTTSTN